MNPNMIQAGVCRRSAGRGTDEMRKSFMSQVSEEVLLRETGQLVPGTEHTFLGRRPRHNGDSIDVCVSQTYIETYIDSNLWQRLEPPRLAKY